MAIPLWSGPSAANAAVSLPIPGRSGMVACVTYLSVSFLGGATSSTVTLTEGDEGAVRASWDVNAQGPTPLIQANADGMYSNPGQGWTINATAAGAGVIGKINAAVKYRPA